MPRRKYGVPLYTVSEDVRIAVNYALRNFMRNATQTELEFPSSFQAYERAYIHDLAKTLNLQSKSRGKGSNRCLTVYKREGSTIVQSDAQFQLVLASRQVVGALLCKHPLSNKERQDLTPLTERDRTANNDLRDVNKSLGRLPSGVAQVPPLHGSNPELAAFRQTLPIWPHKEDIIKTISDNSVCIIEGQTGSGKTTQVPQFILEYCRAQNKPCRMIVTEPRRIAVVNVCDRVCLERDDKPGGVVGYQIRLESRISPKTILTFCTNGVLLRTLMSGESAMANVTHIIVDEVHERDKFSDFLLIGLRELLSKFRNLRLILMSATIDTEIFSKYFGNCPVVSVPGRQQPVREYFLEHILRLTGYKSKTMVKAEAEKRSKTIQKEQLEKWMDSISIQPVAEPTAAATTEPRRIQPLAILASGAEVQPEKIELEPYVAAEMDNAISEGFLNGTQESIETMLNLIVSENVSADYQHSKTGVTPLMVAVVRNCTNTAEQLLNLGANIWIKAANNKTALDLVWEYTGYKEMADLLQSYSDQRVAVESHAAVSTGAVVSLTEDEQNLLNLYHASFDDDEIDFDLLMNLLIHVHVTSQRGSILVFLAGYEDILTVRDRIQYEERRLSDHMKFVIFVLHSKMQTAEQRKVFRPAAFNTRKIILSTNIAETSLTIDDVVYVIDCGKVKVKSFDPLVGVSTLRMEWISQSCAQQRMGRAGRTQPGVCYHLFSSTRYSSMQANSTPEILRVPLQELCLHSKLLAPSNTPIADFLARALEPPPFLVTRNAVQLLKTIDALDPWEDLTELGIHLLDLPVEPRLGKMLMYACVLKCLDPVLTIVCSLAYRDPFILPSMPAQKRASHLARKKLGADSYSDHLVLLRVFQQWQHAKSSGLERSFCEKNFVSLATLEMVLGHRAQLLSQLRASGFVRTRAPGDIRDLNVNSENWAVVKACLCAGTYPNLARVDREHSVLRTRKECKVTFHPSSALRDLPRTPRASIAHSLSAGVAALPTDWVMYEEMSRTGHFCNIRTCTVVAPITVALFSGSSRLSLEAVNEAEALCRTADMQLEPDSDSEAEEKAEEQQTTFKADDWVQFKVDAEVSQMALHLRLKWHSLFLRRMKAPNKPWTPTDDAIVKSIVNVLTAEELALNLTQPPGVGLRPRAFASERDDEYPSGQNNQYALMANLEGKSNVNKKNNGGAQGFSKYEVPDGKSAPDSSEYQARYFIIKAPNLKVIETSMHKGTWNFQPNTERKLTKALKDGKDVILFFSNQCSGNFQGVAKLLPPMDGKMPDGSVGHVQWAVQWIKKALLPFQATRNLFNSLPEVKRMLSSRDGQEVDAKVGAALVNLWDTVRGRSMGEEGLGGRPIRGLHPHYDFQVLQRHPHGGYGGK